SPLQDDIVAFLRAQMTGAKFGEGSGGLAVGALCGNGVVDPGEECDDGNTVSGDCCSAVCFFEQGGCACNDANVCTDDGTCNGTGTCQVVGFNANPCQDGNAWTTAPSDPAVVCVHAATTLACDDGNVCTTDSCEPATGCVHTANAAACDDGNVCTTADTCSNGTCVGGPPLVCPTGAPAAVVEADTSVTSDKATTNFGTSKLLNADAGPAVQRTFLRVRVAGVGTRQVTGAHLRLQVASVTNAQSV